MILNRFDRSAIRAFFTLPQHLLEKENIFIETIYSKPFKKVLYLASSIRYKGTSFYPIWFDDPASLKEEDKIDLSFRDFSAYQQPPVVLIRKSFTKE